MELLNPNDLSKIDAYITAQMRNIPGLAVAIVRANQVIYLRGFGKANLTGHTTTPQTPFIIGSLSKSFTALAIMQLVEAGKIGLDVTVQHYLPWFQLADPIASAKITIRHLLSHTSGISRFAGRELLGQTRNIGMEQQVRKLQNLKLSKPVGTFQYSNTNYLVLGFLIEVISGEKYGDYIRRHIFKPLEMHHSFTSQEDAQPHGIATGYRWWFGLPFPAHLPYVRDALPAGFLLSSAEDMAHYLIAHINGGYYGHTSILTSTSIEEMHRPGVAILSKDKDAYYGMGWLIESMYRTQILSHAGDTANFHADMVILPEDRYGIVVLINVNNVLAGQVEAKGALGMGHIAIDIINLLRNQRPPTSQIKFRTFYAIFDLILSLLLVWQLRSLVTLLHHWLRPQNDYRTTKELKFTLPIIWEMIIPGLIYSRLPKWIDAPRSVLKLYVPDFTYWFQLMLSLSFVTGTLRALGLISILIKFRSLT